jgi:hypothetical protein
VAKARTEWWESQPSLNPGKLTFSDETASKPSLVRLYGRSPRGTRLIDTSPHDHWKTSTFIGGAALACHAAFLLRRGLSADMNLSMPDTASRHPGSQR